MQPKRILDNYRKKITLLRVQTHYDLDWKVSLLTLDYVTSFKVVTGAQTKLIRRTKGSKTSQTFKSTSIKKAFSAMSKNKKGSGGSSSKSSRKSSRRGVPNVRRKDQHDETRKVHDNTPVTIPTTQPKPISSNKITHKDTKLITSNSHPRLAKHISKQPNTLPNQEEENYLANLHPRMKKLN